MENTDDSDQEESEEESEKESEDTNEEESENESTDKSKDGSESEESSDEDEDGEVGDSDSNDDDENIKSPRSVEDEMSAILRISCISSDMDAVTNHLREVFHVTKDDINNDSSATFSETVNRDGPTNNIEINRAEPRILFPDRVQGLYRLQVCGAEKHVI
uniref:Uncharacterized protein n=1 Tax=Spongospora subterranea TaxID=70186 RepID=A0A0H5RLP6_9EUKA|eukprot:CRZ09654.1 hypothetical protein [Spongospora subterranea]